MCRQDLLSRHVFIEVPLNGDVDEKVADHADLSIFIGDNVFVAPCIYEAMLRNIRQLFDGQPQHQVAFKRLTEKVVCGINALGRDYPLDIAYNAVKLKNHFFHKLAYTEPEIFASLACEKINVGQGYTRCSTMVLSDEAVITEDVGLARQYHTHGYNVLVIDKGYVELPGYNYGFFGGAGGVIEDTLVLNGALKHHPNGDVVIKFVHQLGLNIIELHDGPLVDCGSILYLNIK